MIRTPHQKAFSMLELIFVIVILGIVASIGAEVVAKVYTSYITQRAQHRASLKTELVATQIANRLDRAIPGTIGRRNTLNQAWNAIDTPLPNATVLQWVGSDEDSFDAGGWSGFADVDSLNSVIGGNRLSTPGSNLALANAIIGRLGGNLNTSRIYYRTRAGLQNIALLIPNNIDILNLNAPLVSISEHYKLAFSSYALNVIPNPGPNPNGTGTLNLIYNFPPQDPPRATLVNVGTTTALLNNVVTFQYTGDADTIRFKLCVSEPVDSVPANNIVVCKEKVVF